MFVLGLVGWGRRGLRELGDGEGRWMDGGWKGAEGVR